MSSRGPSVRGRQESETIFVIHPGVPRFRARFISSLTVQSTALALNPDSADGGWIAKNHLVVVPFDVDVLGDWAGNKHCGIVMLNLNWLCFVVNVDAISIGLDNDLLSENFVSGAPSPEVDRAYVFYHHQLSHLSLDFYVDVT